MTNPAKPLEIATDTYYWKPMAALFRSVELKFYQETNVTLAEPILDLGCGDGQVARILGEMGVLGKPVCGIDISMTELKKAKEANAHLDLVLADANHLPFKDEYFLSVMSNGVLCSIFGGADTSLEEVERVLKTQGTMAATVPTDKFIDVLIVPKVLGKFSQSLSSSYVKGLMNRLPHFNMHSPQIWQGKFENSGLKIIKSRVFFYPQTATVWNVLSLQGFRLFGALKLVANKSFTGLVSKLWQTVFQMLPADNYSKETEIDGGYMFIVAQKG